MTETATVIGDRQAAIGPGRLILVVGPSGAGKDTLLGLAKAACADDNKIVFPRRVVTREASKFEDNQNISLDAFRQARARCEFAMHWEAHGHCYGLSSAINGEIRTGRTVVANVSRTVIEAVRRAYAYVTVISITAPSDILARRLAARARGSDGQIENRLQRTVNGADAVPDAVINNVGSAEAHARELIRIVRGE